MFEKFKEITQAIEGRARLIAVSKQQSIETIQAAYALGIRDFGENRVDEALLKMEALPPDIRWHFIGKLQSKKVPKVVGRFALIHSVDTLELAQLLSLKSVQKSVVSSILLQVNTSGEASKSGLSPREWERCYDEALALPALDIRGLMTMAPQGDLEEARSTFRALKFFQERLEKRGRELPFLSMGMSGDYLIALEEGSTLVRLGSALFS